MIKFIASALWNSPLPLGHLAPYVLGLALGRFPNKLPKEKNKNVKTKI